MTVGLLSHGVSIPSVGPTLGILIGLGVGIDYALFVVTRHRSNLKDGMCPQEAAVRTLNTSALGDHGGLAMGGRGEQVRDEAVRADRAPDRLAVDGDRGQPPRPGDGEGHRPGQGAAGQVSARMAGEPLRAEAGEDPGDRVRVRGRDDSEGVAAAPERGQHVLAGATHPRGDVIQGAEPHSTAAVHIARMLARECRTPRGSRGSGTSAKHPARSPPLAPSSLTACPASTSSAAPAADASSSDMRDRAGSGAPSD